MAAVCWSRSNTNMIRVQVFFLVQNILFFQVIECVVYPTIHWAPDNPLFNRNDSLIYVLPSSLLHVVCPNPSTVLKRTTDSVSNKLYQNFWIVPRESYERCDTAAQGSRMLLRCNEPLRLKYFTLVFQRYSAIFNPVYIPGEEYYFIATSDGSQRSVYRKSGGNCKHANMKLRIRLCINHEDPNCFPLATATTRTRSKTTTRPAKMTTKPTTGKSSTDNTRKSTILYFSSSSVTPHKTNATTHAPSRLVQWWSRLPTSQISSSAITATTELVTQVPVAHASSNDEPDEHHSGLLEAVSGLNWIIIIPLMACLLLSLIGNIILICRLRVRPHEYQLPEKDHKTIEATSIKRSGPLLVEPQEEKKLLFRITEDATNV